VLLGTTKLHNAVIIAQIDLLRDHMLATAPAREDAQDGGNDDAQDDED
jgi:hypothetical protein